MMMMKQMKQVMRRRSEKRTSAVVTFGSERYLCRAKFNDFASSDHCQITACMQSTSHFLGVSPTVQTKADQHYRMKEHSRLTNLKLLGCTSLSTCTIPVVLRGKLRICALNF